MAPSNKPLKPLSVPQVIEDSLPSDNIRVRCTHFLLVTTQAVTPLHIILKNNELRCTMDGLVIESISLLTLLEVGDVPYTDLMLCFASCRLL